MTLLLSEADVQGLLSMDECIAALEEGYRDLVSGEGQNIPRGRIRFAAKNKGEASYLFNCIPGASRRLGVCAVGSIPNRGTRKNSRSALTAGPRVTIAIPV